MKIDLDLALENWVDTFQFLSRGKLAALLPHIGDEQEETKNRPIADRQFVSNVQFYLHRCGNVTLGQFSIKLSSKGPVFVNNAGQELLLAEVPPMPSNIKSFKEITINYYDQSVLGFLQEFRHNSLFTNVNITLTHCDGNRRKFDAMSQMMTQLWPSITSIESLRTPICCEDEHPIAIFLEKHSAMYASARILIDCRFGFGYDDWYRHWLHIPREDGRPRFLVNTVLFRNPNQIDPIISFVEKIKKDFLDANQAVSFFADLFDADVQSVSLDNKKTHEKLVINETDAVRIARYPMGATEEWIEEMRVVLEDLVVHQREDQERKIVMDLNIKSGYFTCSLC